ncbi:MAG TPA: glycosyltransferase [Cytophagaceae bacterium]|jgi:biofilm PGA synthesis N-glycosyltransferase PgaC|nr:glycosyltransferase [Cytophagaceae bacterium]
MHNYYLERGIDFFNWGILIFAITIMSSYLFLAAVSIMTLSTYLRRNSFVDYNVLLPSDQVPPVTLIAPAYNEGMTIEENVRSLLSLHYSNYEVIIVNDGSKDNSMEIMIRSYQLEKVNFAVNQRIATKEIRGIYKSTNPAFKKLIVVDKMNGGKSDALNVGINVSSFPYIACIDVDCVLEHDALLKMIKPFMEETSRRVIATGGVVRIANSCIVKSGRLLKVNLPEKFLPRVQVLEYIRAFLLGRMAWARLDGLLLISGAFGMFDKDIVIKAGGYNHKTVGEDMELVVRMRRYMLEQKIPYTVSYIPDPLCWTEAPDNYTILGKQRNRWTRGTMETLWLHRKMFLNPKYKVLGLLSYPYWFCYEYLAPIIEFLGIIYTLILAEFGMINWKFFFLLLIFVYTFAVMFSLLSLLTEEYTFRQYRRKSDFIKLVGTAMLEPIIFHPFVVYAAIRGNIDKMRGAKGWGDMVRAGFTKKE